MLNPNTRVAVCCYDGDQTQVIHNLGLYLHHECPLVVLSPEDSKAEIRYPGIENRYGGKRAYIGQDSLDRQRRHLELLLEFPEDHFLIHDSDSLCLDPKIPAYLYAEPDLVWSNLVIDAIPEHQAYFPEGWPHIALQPPYFLSRKTITAMLAVAESIVASPCMPFIDFYMVQLTCTAGLPWRRFENCVSCPISAQIGKKMSQAQREIYDTGFKIGLEHVRKGANMVHSVKDPVSANALVAEYKRYLARGGKA
jgi:hypothetical protein